ncbi:MAG: SRPBCC family protein [Thermoleophilaceae bacterium]
MRIEATAVVPAAPEAVFRFLSDLENHWRLADRWIEVVELERSNGAHGGRVRMRGPLGIGRTARTTVVDAQPEHVMHGTAELGRTRALIGWELHEDVGGTAVRLSANVERTGLLDGLLLALGGRAWMQRRFEAILATLAQHFS